MPNKPSHGYEEIQGALSPWSKFFGPLQKGHEKLVGALMDNSNLMHSAIGARRLYGDRPISELELYLMGKQYEEMMKHYMGETMQPGTPYP